MKFSVFGKGATRQPFRLIEDLRVSNTFTLRLVVTFIDEYGAIILHFISIGRVGAD